MMKKILICLIVAGCFMVNPAVLLAAEYYVSASAGNDANPGSYQKPWKSIGQVNSFAFNTGDDVYFKCGDRWIDNLLTIDWGGSEANHVNIGAYYMSGGAAVIGISGERPKLDGQENVLPTVAQGRYCALLRIKGVESSPINFIEIKNFQIVNSQYKGIEVIYAKNVVLDNIYVYRCGDGGVLFNYDSDNGVLKNSVIKQTVLGWSQWKSKIDWWSGDYSTYIAQPTWSAGVTIVGSDSVSVKNNEVCQTYGEGIDAIAKSANSLIEGNVVWNVRSGSLYFDRSYGGTFRYNLVYVNPSDKEFAVYSDWAGGVCSQDNCIGGAYNVAREVDLNITGEFWIYGNVAVGPTDGIRVGTGMKEGDVVHVYNNTIATLHGTEASNMYGLYVSNDSNAKTYIRNNLFMTDGGAPTVSGNYPFTTFSHNAWSAGQSQVDADARGIGDVYNIGNPLVRTVWNNLELDIPQISDVRLALYEPLGGGGYLLPAPMNIGMDGQKTILPGKLETVLFSNMGFPIGALAFKEIDSAPSAPSGLSVK